MDTNSSIAVVSTSLQINRNECEKSDHFNEEKEIMPLPMPTLLAVDSKMDVFKEVELPLSPKKVELKQVNDAPKNIQIEVSEPALKHIRKTVKFDVSLCKVLF